MSCQLPFLGWRRPAVEAITTIYSHQRLRRWPGGGPARFHALPAFSSQWFHLEKASRLLTLNGYQVLSQPEQGPRGPGTNLWMEPIIGMVTALTFAQHFIVCKAYPGQHFDARSNSLREQAGVLLSPSCLCRVPYRGREVTAWVLSPGSTGGQEALGNYHSRSREPGSLQYVGERPVPGLSRRTRERGITEQGREKKAEREKTSETLWLSGHDRGS